MKKLIALLLALSVVMAFAACGKTDVTTGAPNPTTTAEPQPTTTTPAPTTTVAPTPEFDPAAKSEGVMTYAEYAAAELNTEVVIETFVQAKQGWWEKDGVGLATFYTQDTEGAYFLYNMPCSKEDYDKMTVGTHIRVTGWKSDYAGEVEITDATYEILEDGTFVAETTDVTALLGADNLADYMNMFVAIKGATVAACNDNGDAFMYKWNGSGAEGDDLYFCVTVGEATYTFCVESYLCGVGSDAYEAVRALKVGDVIDLEGFLYWYNGAQPHITSVKAAA